MSTTASPPSRTPPPFQLLTPPPDSEPGTLFVLDSSFNPPTTAHLHLALSALCSPSTRYARPRRLLLLLAAKNADKADVPASGEQRVEMMMVLGGDVRAGLLARSAKRMAGGEAPEEEGDGDGEVDIGLTPHALFLDKARAVAESGVYGSTKQVFILGFDTLARLLEARYYDPPSLAGLGPLFDGGVRVHLRPLGEGGEEEQRVWIGGLGEVLEELGGQREWAGGIEVVGVDGEGGERCGGELE